MSNFDATSYPKDKIKVLFLENISDKAVQYFKDMGYTDVKKVSGALSEEELIKIIKDVHILGIRSKTFISKKVLESAKKLQAIGCFCIGVNQVDIKAASKKGVVVFNPEYGERLGVHSKLELTYKRIGDFMKKNCKGYFGYIFTGNPDLAKKIGLKADKKIEFYNGKLDCRLLQYELYDGSKREPLVVNS